ncbi:MAG: hypothetical protein OXF79_18435 [Chloroflexi bacterium]|nr:hypothetical protein [Chloroflexota bacterium]
MAIFPKVIARLREDDGILGMDDIEYLEVYFAFDGWPETLRKLLPNQWLRQVALFVKRLDENGARVAERPYCPDMRSPNGRFGLKMDDDVIVAFHHHRPAWYWEKKEEAWRLNALWADRLLSEDSFLEFGYDIAHYWVGDDRPAGPLDVEEQEPVDSHDAEILASNDPERLLPDPLFGVLGHFLRILNEGHAQLEGTPYLLVPGQPNSACRYRSNGEFIVAYRPVGNDEYEQAWCWKRKPGGAWKLYMLLAHPTQEIHDDYAVRELGEGTWG